MKRLKLVKFLVTVYLARKFDWNKHKKYLVAFLVLYSFWRWYSSRSTSSKKVYPIKGDKLRNLTMVGKHASEIGLDDLPVVVAEMRQIFQSNLTRPLANRRKQLERLSKMIKDGMPRIMEALEKDLHKSKQSAQGEIFLSLRTIRHQLSDLEKNNKPRRAGFSFFLPTSTSVVMNEPYGTILLHGIWNFPFELVFTPLAGAIAAGNNVVIKPCNEVPTCAQVMSDLIHEYMDPRFVQVVGGPGIPDDRMCSDKLLDNHFDKIMFTGSTNGGRFVLSKAARFLTPCLLELGGKNPVFVDKSADLALTATEVWRGRQANCGQVCISADYLLVERHLVDPLIRELTKVKETTMSDWRDNAGRLVNEKQFARVKDMVEGTNGRVLFGGDCDEKSRHFEPTLVLMDGLPAPGDEVDIGMSQETFGPVLWIVPVSDMQEAVEYVRAQPKPLSLYIFSYNQENIDYIAGNTSSGAVLVNGTLSQYMHDGVPFGGVGNSGMGAYHGKMNFEAFCHPKGVIQKWKFTLPKPIAQMMFGFGILKA